MVDKNNKNVPPLAGKPIVIRLRPAQGIPLSQLSSPSNIRPINIRPINLRPISVRPIRSIIRPRAIDIHFCPSAARSSINVTKDPHGAQPVSHQALYTRPPDIPTIPPPTREETFAALEMLDETGELPDTSVPEFPAASTVVAPSLKTKRYWNSTVDPDVYPDVTDVGDLFLDILGRPDIWKLFTDSKTRKQTVWQKIAKELETLGHKADDDLSVAARTVEVKFNNVRTKYKMFKDNGGPGSTGNAGKSTPKYYEKMDRLLGGSDDITPKECIDSLSDTTDDSSRSNAADDPSDTIIKQVKKSCKGTPQKRKFEKVIMEEFKLSREQIAQNHTDFMEYLKEDKKESRKIQKRTADAFESLVAHVTGKRTASADDGAE